MVKIDSVGWGKVKINGQNYHQVLIINNQIIERNSDQLHQLFGTSHQIGDWEEKLLLSGQPEIIIIASGWNGVLKVKENLKSKITGLGIELKVVLTPSVVSEYNWLVAANKKVNALIHTTC